MFKIIFPFVSEISSSGVYIKPYITFKCLFVYILNGRWRKRATPSGDKKGIFFFYLNVVPSGPSDVSISVIKWSWCAFIDSCRKVSASCTVSVSCFQSGGFLGVASAIFSLLIAHFSNYFRNYLKLKKWKRKRTVLICILIWCLFKITKHTQHLFYLDYRLISFFLHIAMSTLLIYQVNTLYIPNRIQLVVFKLSLLIQSWEENKLDLLSFKYMYNLMYIFIMYFRFVLEKC